MIENEKTPPGVYWKKNPGFMSQLTDYLVGKRVLEIFSGNGYLASLLQENGISVTPTSLRMSHDAHDMGFYTEVKEQRAPISVLKYKDSHDVLLMTWPTVTDDVYKAVQLWPRNKPIVYVGEVTDLSRAHYGGCGTDELWNNVSFVEHFDCYQGNQLEQAGVIRLK